MCFPRGFCSFACWGIGQLVSRGKAFVDSSDALRKRSALRARTAQVAMSEGFCQIGQVLIRLFVKLLIRLLVKLRVRLLLQLLMSSF